MAVEYATTYERSWAIVIGVDRYLTLPPLRHAVADARAVAQTLIEQYDFDPAHVIQLYDEAATARMIHKLLDRLGKPGVIGRDDRLIFFLAGHGLTRRAPEREVGYFAPVDARREDWGTLIPFTEITERTDSLPAKHIFYIMDACYSGHVVLRGLADRAAEEFIARVTRQILTAGMADEMVADGGGPGGRNSIFTGHLLDGLRGEAADVRGMLSASSLISYVYRSVINDPRAHQTPLGGWLRGDGDFIFRSAAPQHLPAHFFRRAESASEEIRLGAVADLALLAVAMSDPVGNEALKALEVIAGTDPNDLVRRTAKFCLQETFCMLKDGQSVSTTRLDEARQLLEATHEDAYMGGTNGAAVLKLQAPGVPDVFEPPAGGVIPSHSTSPPQASPRPIPAESTRRRATTHRLSASGLSAVLIMLLLVVLVMAGAIFLLVRHSADQASMIEAMRASADGATMASLIESQETTLEYSAASQLLRDKQAQATAQAPTAIVLGATPAPLPTATFSPTPPPTETWTPPGAVVFVDDFAGNRGWLPGGDPDARLQIQDGRLHFALERAFALWYVVPEESDVPALENFALDVEAQELTPLTDGALLILVRGQRLADAPSADGLAPLDSYVCIGVQSNGQVFVFAQVGDRTPIPLAPLQTLPQGPLPAGEPVRIRVMAQDGTLTLAVNDIQALSVTSSLLTSGPLTSGRIALGAWSHNIAPYHVAFDNLNIFLPGY